MLIQLYKFQPAVVISRTRFHLISLTACLFAKFCRSKHIHIEHGSCFVESSNPLVTLVARAYDYTLGSFIFRNSDINISISQAVQSFVNNFDKRKSPIIYRGLDTVFIDSIKPDRNIRNKYKDKLIAVYAGRLTKWKGIHNTIAAIKSLPLNLRDKIIFLIIGYGNYYNFLNSHANGQIAFLGKKSRKKTIAILKSSDIYIHSSLPGGGLSTSLLEAMYCGCLVVASPHEGAGEVVNSKRGILLESPSEEEIARALEKVLINVNYYRDRTVSAKKYIKRNFTWDKTAGKFEKIISRL